MMASRRSSLRSKRQTPPPCSAMASSASCPAPWSRAPSPRPYPISPCNSACRQCGPIGTRRRLPDYCGPRPSAPKAPGPRLDLTERLPDGRSDLRAEQFDRAQRLGVREGRHAHLETYPGDSAQSFIQVDEFFGHGRRVADQIGAIRTATCIKLRTSRRRPAAFLANLREAFGPAGKELVGRFLRGISHVTESVHADFELLGGEPRPAPGFTIEINQRPETAWLATDDGDHERQAEQTGTSEGLRSATHSQPDGEPLLNGPR